VIYNTDPKVQASVLKEIEKQNNALVKYDTKGKFQKYVSTCLKQAQSYFKINKKENCIEKLNQAVAYCHEHPNVPLKGKFPFELIPNSSALLSQIDSLFDFYFGLYNKIEELTSSKRIHYMSQCIFAETKEDTVKKSGMIIPIPLLPNIRHTKTHFGVFTHIGWVFATDEDLTFIIMPSLILLTSSSPLDYTLRYRCAFPTITEFNMRWQDIYNVYMIDHVVPHRKTVRIADAHNNTFDVMVYSDQHLSVLEQKIADYKDMGINSLTFRDEPSIMQNFSDPKKKLQQVFIDRVQGMRGMHPR
jgi:hypothetical protein